MSSSGKIKKLLKLGGVATLDIASGSFVSFVTNAMYSTDPSDFTFLQLLTRVFTRSFMTAFLMDEVRDFLYPYDFDDPTGGFFFAMAALWQPQLYTDARLLVAKSIENVTTLPIFNYFPTLSDAQKNPNDPDHDTSKPSESRIQSMINAPVKKIESWTAN